ncbi:ATP-binding protein [Streptomyces avicenniae]|uniref:ATP-binding protein n=1 Tax=Streptomyces avicenniae TaxID=500153 RepID=UPI00069ABA0C|nr:ATP-binding protein [Streptomyces avicenniae]
MTPLIEDALVWAPTGGMLALGALALHYRKKAADQRTRATAFESQAAAAGARAADAERWIAVRDEEAQHLAEVRLPALVYALQDGTDAMEAAGGTRHPQLAGTVAGKAYLSILEQVNAVAAEASEQAEGAARSAVQAVTRSVQALVYEQQSAITHLLDTEHDEKFLELVQPIDHAASQLARRLQILGVLTGMWPGRQRDDAPLLETVRGGVSRIRDFHRVRVPKESAHYVAGRYVEPIVLAVAELLDNAARHSAPSTPVEVSFLEAHHGISIEIHDAGPGLRAEAREEAGRRLSGERPIRLTELRTPPSFGHLGVGALAAQYGFRASVDEEHSVHGGVRAVLHVPRELLAAPPGSAVSEQAATSRRTAPAPKTSAASAAVKDRPSAAAQAPADEPQEYPVAEDGLPVRRRARGERPERTRQAAEPPSPDASQALAAFVRGTEAARNPTD